MASGSVSNEERPSTSGTENEKALSKILKVWLKDNNDDVVNRVEDSARNISMDQQNEKDGSSNPCNQESDSKPDTSEVMLDPSQGTRPYSRTLSPTSFAKTMRAACRPQPKLLSSAMGLIKCPPYCRSNCCIQHHPLLVAILNCVDVDKPALMEMKLGILKDVVNKYKVKQSIHWDPSDIIPDLIEQYRYPMIHWACTLGRVGAASWMIDSNILPVTTQAMTQKAETGLHRAIVCLQETCPKEAASKFVQLLSVMEPAISIKDRDGNTPLHICCDMLRVNLPHADFYTEVLRYMVVELSRARSREEVAAVINMKNSEGDTALHLLAENSKWLTEIKLLVKMGADVLLVNDLGLTPYQISEGNHCYLTSCYFISTFTKKTVDYTSVEVTQVKTPSRELSPLEVEDINVSLTNVYPNETALSHIDPEKLDSAGKRIVTEFPVRINKSTKHIQPATAMDSQSVSGSRAEDPAEEPPKKIQKLIQVIDEVKSCGADGQEEEPNATCRNLMAQLDKCDMTSTTNKIKDSLSPNSNASEDGTVSQELGTVPPELGTVPQELLNHSASTDCSDECNILKIALKTGGHISLDIKSMVDNWGKNYKFLFTGHFLRQLKGPGFMRLLTALKEKDGQLHLSVVKDILSMRNQMLQRLQGTITQLYSTQQDFLKTQNKQENMVTKIMSIVERLGRLQKEEVVLDNELKELEDKLSSTHTTHDQLTERSQHCQEAMKVLKRIHQESK